MFELTTTDPLSPVTVWLDQIFRERLQEGYQLSQNGHNLPLPDRALLRLYVSHGFGTNLSMNELPAALVRAAHLQDQGVRIINGPVSHFTTDDKLLSASLCRAYGLPVSPAWDAHRPDGKVAPAPYGWITKPRWGELGRDVTRYDTLEEAQEVAHDSKEPMIVQHYLPDARCIRVVASQKRVYAAYEKWMPSPTLVAAISLGGERREVDHKEYNMGQLAMRAVRACNADFAGVDVLISQEKAYILELNISPGGLKDMDAKAQELLIDDILDMP